MPAYANGQRFVSKGGRERERFSDPDACSRTGLPVAWQVETARAHESSLADDLLQRVRERVQPETVALDKGYDVNPVYEACERIGAAPIIPLRQTPFVKRGDHLAPTCEHGTWTFAGADFKRKATKWRFPTGRCAPKSRWIKADRLHPLVPRETKRWRDLYRGRAAVEREFGTLKHRYGLAPSACAGWRRFSFTPI